MLVTRVKHRQGEAFPRYLEFTEKHGGMFTPVNGGEWENEKAFVELSEDDLPDLLTLILNDEDGVEELQMEVCLQDTTYNHIDEETGESHAIVESKWYVVCDLGEFLTNEEVVSRFKESCKEEVFTSSGRSMGAVDAFDGDHVGKREYWNNFIDSLHRDGQITESQAQTIDFE